MSGAPIAERIALRELRLDDAQALFAYRSDPAVMRYQGWEPATVDEVRDFIVRNFQWPYTPGTWHQLGIAARATGELIGDCGVHVPLHAPEQAELGITLAARFQGQGYATEAMRLVLGLVFDGLGKHRAFGSVDPRNTRSIALMHRVGFRREAHFVESLRFKGEWADDVVFAMLRREWSSSG